MHTALSYRLLVSVALLGSFMFNVQGQGLTNQSNLYVGEGLEIHVNGEVINSGFIQNQGDLFVSGDCISAGIYQGLGRITLNGSTQTFNNNNNPVHRLAINGMGAKRIEGKVSISQSLDLILGTVTVADADTLLIEDGVAINGGSSLSYVNGALTHKGSGYKFFPIGKDGSYLPVEFLDITGIKPVTEVEVFETSGEISFPANSSLFSTVYWQRKTVSGTFLNSPVSLGYTVPDGYTNRNILDIFQGESLSSLFEAVGNTTVDYGTDIDKVTTSNGTTASVLVIGETDIPGGVPGAFYFSTTLSPSAADPDNRAAKIFGDQLVADNFQFVVYNRWGLKVYETTSLEEMLTTGWDGHQQGKSEGLPSGAYPYLFRALKKSGDAIEQKGIITIIR